MANQDAASTDQATAPSMNGAKILDVSKITQDTSNPCVLETSDISALGSPLSIARPDAGEAQEVALAPGSNYLFGFAEGDVSSIVESCGDLVMTFEDGAQLTMTNFVQSIGSDVPPVLAFAGDSEVAEGELAEAGEGEIVDITNIIDGVPSDDGLEEPQAEARIERAEVAAEQTAAEVANIEPAAGEELAALEPEAGETAQDLAQIEPAAGEGAGSSGNTGFGFGSSFDPTGVIPLADVGPINPTALQYNLPSVETDLLFEEFDENDNPIIFSPAEITLDETDLGVNTITDTLNIDFGDDGRGAIAANNDFSFGGSALGGNLTSGGQVIDVVETATGYVGTINGGADTVFEFILDQATGSYTFNQFLPLDHADANDANDVITLNFGVIATDIDGDAATATVVVNILDDAPLAIAPDANTIDETALSGGPIVINDSLIVDFGNDAPGALTPDGATSVTGVANLTSNGQAITITPTADGYVGTLAGGAVAFTLVVDPANGDYTFTQNVALDHDAGVDTISLNFGVVATDFDGDTASSTITVNIVDSAPEINDNPTVGTGIENIDESNIPGGTTVSGSVDVDFGSDNPATLTPNNDVQIMGATGTPNAITSGGEAVTITQTPVGYVGTLPGGQTVFVLQIDPSNGDYVFTQNIAIDHNDPTDANEVISLKFGIVATDGDGDSDTGFITINIADDAPIAADDSNAVDESGTVTGNILTNDDGGNDGSPVITEFNGQTIPVAGLQVVGTYGTLTVQQDGSYSYTANANNPDGVDSFPYTITDADGDTADATLRITVSPIDDRPIVKKASDIVDETDLVNGDIVETGKVEVDFGTDGPGTVTPASFDSSGSQLNGNLTSGGVPVTVALVGTTYTGTAGGETIFTMDVQPDGSYTFTLIGTLDHADPNDPNDIINLEFTVNAADGDDDVTPTTITIGVKDDVPTIGDSRGDVDETDFENGNLTYSDTIDTSFGVEVGSVAPSGNAVATVNGNPIAIASNGETVVFTQTADGYIGTTNGGATTVFTLTLDSATGQYVYTQFETLDHPDGNDANDSIELSFDFAVTSTDGDSDTGTVTISVADDGVSAVDDVNGAEEGQNITGSVTANDDFSQDAPNTVQSVEYNGNLFPVSAGNPAVIATNLGTLTLNVDGSYGFVATDLGDPDGTATFTYTLVDGDGDSSTAKLDIRVTPDGEPVAVTEIMTVDETNLTPGPMVINETINVDFGLDGQGSIDPNGDITVSGSSLAGANLTSGGQPVVISETANGYEAVIQGTTTKVFTLTIQDNGDYTFELLEHVDHADATDPNDLIKIEFGITVTDSDGDAANGSVVINILDDAPVALDDTDSVDQGDTSTSGNVVSNDIASEDAPSLVTEISFNGVSQTVVAGVATVIDGNHGRLSIAQDGSYTYTSFGTNATSVQDEFTYSLTDFDGDTDTAELTINIADVDSKPEVSVTPLTVDETDLNPTDTDSDTAVGNFGFDAPGSYEVTGIGSFGFNTAQAENGTLTSEGVAVTVAVVGGQYVGSAGGETIFTFGIDGTSGEYTFTLIGTLDHADTNNPNDALNLTFGVDAIDTDGDRVTGNVQVTVLDDGPVANDDCNEFTVVATQQDFNVVLAMDVSGSMGGDKLTLLKSSVSNLVNDFGDYNGGEIKVHIVPFARDAAQGQTFLVSDAAGLANALSFVDGLTANGTTNYEAPLQSAISWLEGDSANDPIAGADTYTYFISDGSPNRALNDNGTVTANLSADAAIGEITGADGTNEVAILQGLSTKVIGVGIGVDGTTLGRLDIIDGNGDALDVQQPTDLDAALQSTNPLAGRANGNVITGENGGPNAADDLSEDDANSVASIQFGGNSVDVDAVNGATIDGAFGTLTINADGSYEYVVTAQDLQGNITEAFTYTLVDGDGDASTALLTLKGSFTPNDRPDLAAPAALKVDETDLNPTDSDSNVVTADFGNDGPGTYEVTGTSTFSFDNGAANGQLTSNGVAIVVAIVGNSYVGSANGAEVFRLELNETTGAYTFTLSGTLDHADTNNSDDVVNLTFGVTARDQDGDTNSAFVNVAVSDDGPVLTDDSNVAGEGQTVNGNVVANDDVGADKPGSVTTINGEAVGVNGQSIVGQYGTLTIQQDGSYSYTANNNNPVGVDTFTYALTDADGDADTAKLKITVSSENDVPVVTSTSETVDETGGFDTVNGTVNVNFGGDTADMIMADGAFSASDASLTSLGQDIVVTDNGATYTGVAGGRDIFTLTINPDGSYTFTQLDQIDHPVAGDANDVVALNFGVKATDTDGDVGNGTITINVSDDGPNARNDSTAAGEGQTIDGNVIANDNVGADAPGTITMIDGENIGANGKVIVGQYGTLTIQQDGSYSYTANNNNPDGVDTFTYKLSDFDGDTDTAELKITVSSENDVPVIAQTTPLVVDETDLNPTDSDSNVVSADFGADGFGGYAIGYLGAFDFNTAQASNGTLTSNGEAVSVSIVNGEYVGRANGETVFTFGVDAASGEYTFTLIGTLDHADVTDANDALNLTFGVTARDQDGDVAGALVDVKVLDDGPSITGKAKRIDESDLDANNPISYTHTLTHSYGEDGKGSIDPTGDFSAKFERNGADVELTSGGDKIDVQDNANGYVGVANGETVFTLVVQDNGKYTYTQFAGIDHPDGSDADDVIWLKFDVKITDFDGDSDVATIVVDVHDSAPVAVRDTTSAGEGQTINGNVITNDDVGADVPGSITMINGENIGANGKTVVGQYGTLTIQQDGSYSYTANSNNPDGVDSFTYKLSDFDGDTDTAELQITVTSENDVPVVTHSTKSVDETGGFDTVNGTVSVNFGGDAADMIMANGAFSASDNTLTSLGQSIDVTNTGTTYTGVAGGRDIFTLTINPNGSYIFTQLDQIDHPVAGNPDDNVALRFGVKATDIDGDVGNGTITINVRDDGPDARNDTDTADEGQTVTGSVIGNDVVGADKPGTITMIDGENVGANGKTVVGQYGTLTIQQDGSYSYTANSNNPDGVDSFTYKLSDFDGDTDIATLKITVSSENDVPVAVNDTNSVDEGQMVNGSVISNDNVGADGPGRITMIDGQNIGTNGITVNGQYGTLTIQQNGSYKYTAFDGLTSPKSDEFVYKLSDVDGDTDTAKLTIDIRPEEIDFVDNHATLWGNQTSLIGKNLFANDGPSFDGSELNDGTRVESVVYNGTTFAIAEGGSRTINLGFGNIVFKSNGDYDYTVNAARTNNQAGDFTINIIDDAGNRDTQDFTATQRDYTFDGTTLTIVGSSITDVIIGADTVPNVIRGGGGNDFVGGGDNNDLLYGDAGADQFIFSSLTDGVDRIKDFSAAEGDQINLEALISGFDETQDVIDDFVFQSVSGGNTVVSVDVNGSGNAANATTIAIVEGVNGLDLDLAIDLKTNVV